MISQAITIKQISHLSGYSVSTVSKALNNKQDISLQTREVIKDIAKQHNYVPNSYAVSLRIKKSVSIAVVLPKVTLSCYSQALSSLQKTAEKANYRVLFYQSESCPDKELNFIRSLNDGSTSGVILISEGQRKEDSFLGSNMPIEILSISKTQPLETIQLDSKKSFSNLLSKI
ncbi:LacI family DNA-binding transcriptional regulator [Lacinutrix sp.]|uniref:LacI family DNA-binding transcriptional regulator n=1 Tax=Lacinutrix sp. TaxID=1937692 RepID=UPI0025BB0F86|nr:LacI family DNA-binding transcriptional regulator [Lacinutrix sp.]